MTEDPLLSCSDVYTKGAYRPFLQDLRVPKSRVPINLLRFAQPAGDFSDPACADLVLAIPLTSVAGTYDFGGGRHSATFRVGAVCLVPALAPATFIMEHSHVGITLGIRQCAIQHLINEAVGRPTHDFGVLHRTGFRDELCRRLVMAIWDEAASDNPAGQMFIDGAVMSLIARLATLSERKQPADFRGRPLDADGLSRVLDYVEAQLGELTSITELAALLGMRDYEFSRAFKASTNTAPYQFVLDRRIERAKSLLENTSDPLANIAYACGFASQSHMTDVFRARLGVTPGRYRRERRS